MEIFHKRFEERKTYKEIQSYLGKKGIKITIPSLFNFIAVRRRRPDPFAWPEHLRPTANPPVPAAVAAPATNSPEPAPIAAPAANGAMRPTTPHPPGTKQDLKPYEEKTPEQDKETLPKSKEEIEIEERIRKKREYIRNLPTAAEWDIIKAEEEKKKKAEGR